MPRKFICSRVASRAIERPIPAASAAFVRTELVAIITALGLLATLALPLLAQGRPRSQQAVCMNNLRLMGQAILNFNLTHGQVDPWRLPDSESPAPQLKDNSWYHFYLMTNELQTPRILACPSDSRQRAKDFSFNPGGGFLHASYRNNAVSYVLGLDSSFTRPDSILSGDRNMRFLSNLSGCSSGIATARSIPTFGPSPSTSWLNGIHGSSGNVLFHDGRVAELSSMGLSDAFRTIGADDNGSAHLLTPGAFLP